MIHFASELFDTHPRFIQLKSMLLDFFNGEEIERIHLAGLEHVISVTLGPTPDALTTAMSALGADGVVEDYKNLPVVHIRGYTLSLRASGVRTPRVELVPMGPSLDLSLRRHKPADPEIWKLGMKRTNLKKSDVEEGVGK